MLNFFSNIYHQQKHVLGLSGWDPIHLFQQLEPYAHTPQKNSGMTADQSPKLLEIQHLKQDIDILRTIRLTKLYIFVT